MRDPLRRDIDVLSIPRNAVREHICGLLVGVRFHEIRVAPRAAIDIVDFQRSAARRHRFKGCVSGADVGRGAPVVACRVGAGDYVWSGQMVGQYHHV